jgi:error-prone DNA polymerase
MKARLTVAFRANGVSEPAVEYLIKSLASFALYGFPESHAISFALIAYSSAWLKVNRPAAFYASLLNCQPMGFYSPASLVQDGRRHGIAFLPVCVQASDGKCRVDSDTTVRLGIATVRGVRGPALQSMLAARGSGRSRRWPTFLRRTQFSAAERRVLAGAGALNCLADHRRSALWRVEAFHGGDDLFRQAAGGRRGGALAPRADDARRAAAGRLRAPVADDRGAPDEARAPDACRTSCPRGSSGARGRGSG